MNDKEFDEKLRNKQISHDEAMLHIYQLVFVNQYLSRPGQPVYSSIILSEIIARLSKVMNPVGNYTYKDYSVEIREN